MPMRFHLPGLKAATTYKPGFVDALIAAGRTCKEFLHVEGDAYASVLADFGGNPLLEPAAMAAMQAQIKAMGTPCCGGSVL